MCQHFILTSNASNLENRRRTIRRAKHARLRGNTISGFLAPAMTDINRQYTELSGFGQTPPAL